MAVRARRAVYVIGAAIGTLIAIRTCASDEPRPRAPRFATFNIEDFPKDRRQVDGAFALIGELGVPFVALQEIGDPALAARTARETLGDRWDFVHVDTAPQDATYRSHHIGVLYDRDAYTVASTAIHDETRLEGGRQKPVFEVRLAPRDGGGVLRVFVLHLKAGSDGRDLRRKQYIALAKILRAARPSGERIVVLGDFNATEPSDRDDLAALARGTGLVWATESLACSAFWQRADDCPTSRLDHVLTWAAPTHVDARGACQEGCDDRDRCPIYRDHVSDHCPVRISFE